MTDPIQVPQPPQGRLVENIMYFGRVLRAAGLPVGPGTVLQAIRAVEAVGLGNRTDFYWALHAVFVNRRDQREIFDQAFHVFWRNPRLLERMMGMVLPELESELAEQTPEAISPRLAEAMASRKQDAAGAPAEQEIELDAAMTWSKEEVLREKDFDMMTIEELEAARAAIRRMRFSIMEAPTRRYRRDPRGARVDMRASLRAALRSGGDIIPLRYRKRRRRRPPLVILCDISGSMERYSRMLLHLLHAITNDRDRVFTFLFGTRLTNVTRHLKYRDVDVALARVADEVEDWSGGTRIGHCFRDFNRRWGRRVLGQGAVVLLISDGLDRDAGAGLEAEIDRLHRSCRRLIWLNPLLRYRGFEPKPLGIRAILPHVDEFRPVHNLESLMQLAEILSRPVQDRPTGRSSIMEAA